MYSTALQKYPFYACFSLVFISLYIFHLHSLSQSFLLSLFLIFCMSHTKIHTWKRIYTKTLAHLEMKAKRILRLSVNYTN